MIQQLARGPCITQVPPPYVPRMPDEKQIQSQTKECIPTLYICTAFMLAKYSLLLCIT